MRAKLVFSIYYATSETAGERIPLGSEGNVEPCTCICSGFDYHFFPDCLGGNTLVGVKADEVELLPEKVTQS